MEIVKEYPLKSGYEPRPAVPHSAGRALAVLVAVCAVLWVWLMLPDWFRSGSADYEMARRLDGLLFNGWTLTALPLASNYVVWRYVTKPLWLYPRRGNSDELKRGLVLVLAVLFHVASFLLVLFAGFLALAFSSETAPAASSSDPF